MNPMTEETPKHEAVKRHASRVQWACGLCFALLFLMGVSGVASVTLLHDDPTFTSNIGGIEGATLKTVIALRGVIELLHEWGGYFAIVLAGWAGTEVFNFSRRLRKSDRGEWRGTGRWMGPVGVFGGIVIIGSLIALLASGVAAKAYVDHIGAHHSDELSGIDRSGALTSRGEAMDEFPKHDLAEMHVRELNYALALGAILLVLAANSTRGISLALKKEAKGDIAQK
ncbi:MAG: hypothetical protein K8I27_00465 [Planctomycetes bacterium]|nr:hypothetical protein [Planctomycetota bacterium]